MLNWIESRTGFVSMAKGFLTEDIPGGASYWYVFGSATIFAMTVQIVTGIFLTFFYAPSASTAWESTRAMYLNPYMHFLLSVHYWGASAMIALVFLHMLQVLIWGAYKSPRELQWIVGILLLVITLVLGLTGYLLPWDMNAYFASQVSLNITGLGPVAGPILQNIAQGGGTMGTNTINRFFGLHVWLMPAALVALVGAHLAIFRWNGPAGPVVDDPRKLSTGRFYPDQIFMDTFASFVVFVIIVGLAFIAPPFLDAKANPNIQFTPYPAWYFLSLFGLLNLVPPDLKIFGFTLSLELVATIVVPTLGLIIVLLLPWLDRSTTRSFAARGKILWATFAVIAIVVGLSIYSQLGIQAKQAAGPPSESQAKILAEGEAATTQNAGTGPVAGAAAGAPAENSNGAKVFATNCSTCHAAAGTGQAGVAPPLANNPMVTGDPKAVIAVLENGLHGQSIMGQSYGAQMPAWKGNLSNKDIADVITYIRGSLGNNKASAVKEADIK
ncbi:MAG: cytochrome b N-terminal domain-containing protein [Candidatus Eremiobacteraeota bacterium]|nr:cytochrome b N-terminal domain-containing protein [Candidatus Eremiobacteraeota bacterium]